MLYPKMNRELKIKMYTYIHVSLIQYIPVYLFRTFYPFG